MRLLNSAVVAGLVALSTPVHAQDAEQPANHLLHATPRVGIVDGSFAMLGLQLGVHSDAANGSLTLGIARHGPYGGTRGSAGGGSQFGVLSVVGGAESLRESWTVDAGYEFALGSGSVTPFLGFGAGFFASGEPARPVLFDVRGGVGGGGGRGIRAESRLVFSRNLRALVLSLGYRLPLTGG